MAMEIFRKLFWSSEKEEMFKFRPYELTKIEYSKTDRLPAPRSGHRICTDSSYLYVYGGYNYDQNEDEHMLYREIWKFNLVTKKWTKVPLNEDDIPEELASGTAIMLGNTILIYGGTSHPFGSICSNTLWLLNVKTNQIKKFPARGESNNFPPGQYGNSTCVISPFFYTIGGTEGFHYSIDSYRLNLEDGNWELLLESRPEIDESHPLGRYRHEICHDNRFIYVLGGGASDQTFGLKDLPCFDTENKKWSVRRTLVDPKTKTFPNRRKCHSLVQYLNSQGEICVVIAAGITGSNKELDDIWKLNLSSFQWNKLRAEIPTNLFFHDAAITSSYCMMIFAGIVSESSSRRTTRHRTNTIYKIYVEIPKLTEIAFEALIFYKPDIVNRSFSEVVELGVPIEFANRIVA